MIPDVFFLFNISQDNMFKLKGQQLCRDKLQTDEANYAPWQFYFY